MGWVNGKYYYSTGALKSITENYLRIYEGLPISWRTVIYNPWAIAEYKGDFDRALRGIGRGKWTGEIREFKYYRNFGKLQRVIIAYILGVSDNNLLSMRFRNISQLRGYAYYLMKLYLNGDDNEKSKNNAR